MTSDIIRGFNRDTARLATGVLGAVVFAAVVLAVQENHLTMLNPTKEAVKAARDPAARDPLLNANAATVESVVFKSSDDKMASGEGSGVDHAFNKTSPQDGPSSQIEPAGIAPTPVSVCSRNKS